MKMTIRPLTEENLDDFLSYCRAYRFEHDESYLCETELCNFVVGDHNPTVLLYNEKEQLRGVMSVKLMPYNGDTLRGRIRIMHVKGTHKHVFKAYQNLVTALVEELQGVDHLFCFLPEDKETLVDDLIEFGFEVDRYPCLFVRENINVEEPNFPEGIYPRSFVYEKDEETWLEIRNVVMQQVLGSEPLETMDVFQEFLEEEGEISGGMQLLYHKDRPIGCARLVKEVDDDIPYIFIDTIGIIPEYQGKGLGRAFLRHCLQFGQQHGMFHAMLSVNAENKRATKLYLDESFTLAEIMTCLKYTIKGKVACSPDQQPTNREKVLMLGERD